MKNKDNLPLNYKERLNSRTSFLVSIAVLVVLCIVFNQIDYTMIRQPAAQAQKAAEAKKQKEEAVASSEPEVTTATVLAVGDNLIQPSLLASGQSDSGTWNYDSVYANLKSDIQAADIAMVNQETPFTSNHDMVSGTAPYATPTEIGDALVNAGFNVITSATSLIDDNGTSMITETLNYWKNNHPDTSLVGIHEAKTGVDDPVILEINGIKIAFLDYTFPAYGSQSGSSDGSTDTQDGSEDGSSDGQDSSGSQSGSTGTQASGSMVDTFDTTSVAAAIKTARAAADCVIFSANWGKAEEPMPTEYEKEWANFLMQQGVDVVIGTNPNVLQPYGYLTDDEGHNMLIYYSGLKGIPTDLYDAAAVDGAGSIRTFFKVTLPLLMPSFSVCVTLSLTSWLREFGMTLAATNGGPAGASKTITIYIYENLYSYSKAGYGQALSLLFALFLIILGRTVSGFFRKREVEY